MTEALAFRSVAETARLIADGALSPVALVETMLSRIAAFDGTLHAYLLVLEDRALAEARTAEREIRAGRSRGPLHGIPFAVKDTFFTAGVRTCAASRLLLDHVPDRTASAIARLEARGAISVTERAQYIARVRGLAKKVMNLYLELDGAQAEAAHV